MVEAFILERFGTVTGPTVYWLVLIIYHVILVVFATVIIIAAGKWWVAYKRLKFHFSQGSTLLEIQLPQEIKKSPQAMEIILESLHQGRGETTFINRYLEGKTRPWFSLELVSLGGEVHFFIWTRTPLKETIKSAIYSQYPSVEIFEVEDYTKRIPLDLEKYKIWGCEFKLAQPDPYPIKTYKDYAMDKESREEFKVDPLSSLVEHLGILPKDNHIWIQILVRAHKKEKKVRGSWFKKQSWKEEGKETINELVDKWAPPKKKENKEASVADLSDWQKSFIDAIQRNLDKKAFDVGIRGLYISKPDTFDADQMHALINAFKQFNHEEMNSLNPTGGLAGFDYPWQDYKEIRQNIRRKKILNAYKLRSYFFLPYKSPHFVLSVEELATIYHFPGEVVTSPSVMRLRSRKGEAPGNLPR